MFCIAAWRPLVRLQLCAFFSGLLLAGAAAAADKPLVTVGLVDTFSPEFYINTYVPAVNRLMEKLPEYRFRLVELEEQRIEEDIQRLKPDFLLTSAGHFAALIARFSTHQVVVRMPQGSVSPTQAVGSAVIVSGKSPYQRFSDLKGAKIALTDLNSFEGWLFAAGAMRKKGIDPLKHFSELHQTHYGIPDVATLVSLGIVQAGVLASCEVEKLIRTGAVEPGELRVIEDRSEGKGCARSTDLYPDAVFSSLPWVDAGVLTRVTVALLSMPAGEKDFRWTLASDFRPTFELLRTLRFGPFAPIYTLSAREIWERYSTEIIMGAALLLAVLVHIVLLNVLVRRRTRQLRHALLQTRRLSAETQRTRQRMLEMERSHIVSELSSMFAHEIKQPIMNIALYAGTLKLLLKKKHMLEGEADGFLEKIYSEVERSSEIVDHVRAYAKPHSRVRKSCTLHSLVFDAVKTFQPQHSELKVGKIPEGEVLADPFEIEFILTNFLKNAFSAVKGVKSPRVTLSAAGEGENWRIECEDNGPPIPEEMFARLGTVGQSTKPDGLGFGLAIATGLAEANGGHLEFHRREPQGLRASLVLARHHAKEEPHA
ncbi:MAG TPA: hypothetical protein DEO49_06440 [Sutterella sp.]|nr:hypothetical protein [Sutterella sp.]